MSECPSVEQLAAVVGGPLDDPQRAAVAEHAEECATCRAALVAWVRAGESGSAAAANDVLVSGMPTAGSSDYAQNGSARWTEPASGSVLAGRYVVQRKLGSGAMGVVFAARDRLLDREVAIKLLRSGLDTPDLRKRTEREAKAAARIAHPNVVAVHDIAVDGDQIIVVMELVNGTSLREYLRVRRPWREVFTKVLDAGRGLVAVHAAGLVHRDFKPDNVLVGTDGRARVTDFGLARFAEDANPGPPESPDSVARSASPEPQSPLTATGVFVGTPAYASPEQLAGADADAVSDQFAFAATAWEALWGERPFKLTETDRSTSALPDRECCAPGQSPGYRFARSPASPKDGRGIPRAVERVLQRSLARDPRARFASLQALLDALLSAAGRRRRIAIAVASGVAIALTAIAFGVVAQRDGAGITDASVCSGAEAPMAAAWSPNARVALHQRIANGKRGSGETKAGESGSADWIVAKLDRFAGSWTEASRELCVATRVRRERLQSEFARRTECLDDRLADFKRLNSELMTVDGATLERAPSAVAGLRDPATCLTDRSKPGTPPPQIVDQVAAVRRDVANTEHVLQLRGPAKAEAAIAEVRSRADALGDPALNAEVALADATIALNAGDSSRAMEQYRQAIMLAERAGDDRVRAMASIGLVSPLVNQRAFDEAERIAEQARATLDRIGGDPQAEVTLGYVRGRLASRRGDYERAQQLLSAALALADQHHLEPAGFDLLREQGNVLTDLGRGTEAVKLHQEAFERWRRVYGTSYEASLVALSASVEQALVGGDFASACELGERAVLIHQQLGNLSDPMSLDVLRRFLFAAFSLRGDWMRARDHARALAAAARGKGNAQDEFDGLDYAGVASLELGDADSAVAEYRRAVARAESLGKRGLDSLVIARSGLGQALAAAERAGDAIRELEWVLPRMEKQPDSIGNVYASLAVALWQRNGPGDRSRAVTAADSAIRAHERRSEKFDTADPLGKAHRRVTEQRIANVVEWKRQHPL